jgi:hypothetical protein
LDLLKIFIVPLKQDQSHTSEFIRQIQIDKRGEEIEGEKGVLMLIAKECDLIYIHSGMLYSTSDSLRMLDVKVIVWS